MAISINTNPSAAAAPQVGQTINATVTGVTIKQRVPLIDRETGEASGETSPVVLFRFTSSAMPQGWVGLMSLAGFQNGALPDRQRGNSLHLNEAEMLANLMLSANPEHGSLEDMAELSEHSENTAILAIKGTQIEATLVEDNIEVVREDGSRQLVNDYNLTPAPEADAPDPAKVPAAEADTEEDDVPF